MTFIEKAKLWIKETGLTNVGWLLGFAGSLFAGWSFLAGGCIGIFIYINYNIIRKLIGLKDPK